MADDFVDDPDIFPLVKPPNRPITSSIPAGYGRKGNGAALVALLLLWWLAK